MLRRLRTASREEARPVAGVPQRQEPVLVGAYRSVASADADASNRPPRGEIVEAESAARGLAQGEGDVRSAAGRQDDLAALAAGQHGRADRRLGASTSWSVKAAAGEARVASQASVRSGASCQLQPPPRSTPTSPGRLTTTSVTPVRLAGRR